MSITKHGRATFTAKQRGVTTSSGDAQACWAISPAGQGCQRYITDRVGWKGKYVLTRVRGQDGLDTRALAYRLWGPSSSSDMGLWVCSMHSGLNLALEAVTSACNIVLSVSTSSFGQSMELGGAIYIPLKKLFGWATPWVGTERHWYSRAPSGVTMKRVKWYLNWCVDCSNWQVLKSCAVPMLQWHWLWFFSLPATSFQCAMILNTLSLLHETEKSFEI